MIKKAQLKREESLSEGFLEQVESPILKKPIVVIPNRISKLSELERELAASMVQLENQVEDAINSINTYKRDY